MANNKKTKEDYIKDIVEYPQEQEDIEDSHSVYRDMFTKTAEERLEDEDKNDTDIKVITNLNITKKTDEWTDNPKNIKFDVGKLVTIRGSKNKIIYKVCGFHRDNDTYMIKPSLSEFSTPKKGCLLEEAPENSKWEPLILDPYKLWKMQQGKKKNGK